MSVTRARGRAVIDGVVVVDKPTGPTSHDVVARVRRVLSTRHAGHAGTLDPMASGVLVIAAGEATKLVPYLTADDKAYVTSVRLGVATDTLDAEGTVTERIAVPEAVREAVAALGATEVTAGHMKVTDGHIEVTAGDIGANARKIPSILASALAVESARTMQSPPAYSAIRIGGERAHEIARRGETPDLAPRPVAVRALRILSGEVEGDVVSLTIALDVSKGYFVRAFARDLAASLGTVGHLTALRRTRSGAFTLDDAIALDALTSDAVMPMAKAASRALPVTVLDDAGVRAVSFGQRVPAASLRDPHRVPSAWLDEAGALVAIGEATEDGGGRVLRGFPRRPGDAGADH